MGNIKEIKIVPTPKEIRFSGTLSSCKAGICVTDPAFLPAAEAFAEYAGRMGFSCPIAETAALRVVRDTSVKQGAYSLKLGSHTGILTASDCVGINHALAALLQIIEADPAQPASFLLPECEITDAPDCQYRGMMVDLARNWHDFAYLLSYVDICYFYRISVLHLHFTDDQSYTLPSALFPKLSTPGRSYTAEQIAKLNQYAQARGVQLMPEIDVPGHCVSFQQGYPELFGTGGIICQHPDAIKAMQALFRELCALFPYSEYIHIGGDEAKIENWLQCPRCRDYARQIGIDVSAADQKLAAEQLYANFISKMAEPVLESRRIPVAWEGFAAEVNDRVSREIRIMSWENYYQVTPSLIRAGFRILNCSWNPMYIVAPEPAWPPQDLYQWSIYRWMPVHPGSPYLGAGIEIEPTPQVFGGQLLAWGDRIAASYPSVAEGIAAERRLLTERAPYLAENTWNREKRLSFEALSQRITRTDARLAVLIGRETNES